jgi:hypothetical protein
VIAPRGGKAPGGVPGGLPGGAEASQRLGGQGDGPVFGALPAVAMALEALAVNVGDLQGEGLVAPQSQAIDGGAVDVVVQGGRGRQETRARLHTEPGGETGRDLRASEREGIPSTREDRVREEAEATGAATQGCWGEAVDILPVQEGVLEGLFRDAVGGLVRELGQQADCSDRGFLSPFAFATEWKSREHVLTQWGPERSPCVRCIGRVAGRHHRRIVEERGLIPAASAAYLNIGLEPTPNSLRSCLA